MTWNRVFKGILVAFGMAVGQVYANSYTRELHFKSIFPEVHKYKECLSVDPFQALIIPLDQNALTLKVSLESRPITG
jgi:hypothetical protein